MSEEFPLDPNQVQPPQEGQVEQQPESNATHIEVTSHEGDAQLGEVAVSSDSQEPETHENEQSTEGEPAHLGTVDHDEDGRVQDIDKARDMAEAGHELRTVAKGNREDTPAAKEYNRARSYDQVLRGKTPHERGEYFDEAADRLEEIAGELYDEAHNSSYSHNPEKAKLMIIAERKLKRNLAEKTPQEVANKYDLEKAEAEAGKPLVEALKDAPDHKVEATFLRYSHLIAERLRKDGDPLSLNLQALDLAYKFVGGWKTLQEHGHNKWVQVAFNDRLDGSIDITKTDGPNRSGTAEKWHVPMFDKVPYNSGGYDRSSTTDTAYYEITETSKDSDGQFDSVQVKKTRKLGEADVANLKKAFGTVQSFDIEKNRDTLYPGDEGYAEAMADINYGRDL